MVIYRVTELTHKEWEFGPLLRRILRHVSKRNPTAHIIKASILVDGTLWEWTFKDEKIS